MRGQMHERSGAAFPNAARLGVVGHASQATDEHKRRHKREHHGGVDPQLEKGRMDGRRRRFVLGTLKGSFAPTVRTSRTALTIPIMRNG
jgi:hypothetical protein